MTIKDFLNGHGFTKTKAVPTGAAMTPEELYDKCISVVCPETKTITDAIIGWHELLLRYAWSDGAVLLTRLYESQKDATGEWDNRRNALTISQNYQYAFCSNYFPRLILTMALNGFVPEYDDFWDMMVTNRDFYLSALRGMAPIEKRIAAYEIKPYKAEYYIPGWYLAHIASVNDMPYKGCNHLDIKTIFKLGEEKDWQYDKSLNCIVRRNDDELNTLEKKLAVAHFLRLVDPMNYFLVPNRYNVLYRKVNPSDKSPLGENAAVVRYMLVKAYERFGEAFKKFLEEALVDVNLNIECSQHENVATSKISADFAVNINPHPASKKYTYDEEIKIVAYYLLHKDGLIRVEENHMGLAGKKGWEAKGVLNSLGINTSRVSKHKGLLLNTNIDDAINDAAKGANDILKTTLEEIKKRKLHLKATP